MNSWEEIKKNLERRMSPEAYRNWVQRTILKSTTEDTISVVVPDEATKICMESDYGDYVLTVIRELKLPFQRVCYEVGTVENGSGHAGLNGNGNRTAPDEVFFGPAA